MTVNIGDFGDFETSWCPGCGNFGIMEALKKALTNLDIPPHRLAMISGIGQAAKGPHYLKCNMFNGLHGRSLPVATGVKAANRELTVIAQSGDGCHYGEGGNHFLHALRRNPDITILAHDNKVYGLTKGQASPTSARGFESKEQPYGTPSESFNPLAVAIAMRASFVARGYCGNVEHLAGLIEEAIKTPGAALIDVLQVCVSFNKINTWKFYNDRVVELEGHDPSDWEAALQKSQVWGDEIPIGVFYKTERPLFEDTFPALKGGALAAGKTSIDDVKEIMENYK